MSITYTSWFQNFHNVLVTGRGLGTSDPTRRAILNIVSSGTYGAPSSVQVNGVEATRATPSQIAAAGQTKYFVYVSEPIPTGATITVKIVDESGNASAFYRVGIFRLTGVANPVYHDTANGLPFGGYQTDSINTVAGGFILGAIHAYGIESFVGLNLAYTTNAGPSFTSIGGMVDETDGNPLVVGMTSGFGNINSCWGAISFTDNGDAVGGNEPAPDDDSTGGENSSGLGGFGGAGQILSGLAAFFRLDTSPDPVRLWCGVNDIPVGMEVIDEDGSVYLGAGRILDLPELEVLLNGLADSVEFSLPGITVESSNRIMSGAPVLRGLGVHVGICNINDRYQPTSPITPVWFGRADYLQLRQEVSNSYAEPPSRTLVLSVGSGMTSRARPRRTSYTEAQQKLLFPTDKFCSRVTRYTLLYEVVWPNF